MPPLLLLLAGGCGAPAAGDTGPLSPCEEAALTTPAAELGTGSTIFEPLEDGDTIEFIQGAQGGFHIYGSLRAQGVLPGNRDDLTDPDNPMVRMQVSRDGEPFGGFDFLPRPLKVRSDGQLELVGEIVILEVSDRDEAAGVEIVLEAELIDACGTDISDRRTLTLEPGR